MKGNGDRKCAEGEKGGTTATGFMNKPRRSTWVQKPGGIRHSMRENRRGCLEDVASGNVLPHRVGVGMAKN